jgi:DNA-binding beta-propeller fold protein YncE
MEGRLGTEPNGIAVTLDSKEAFVTNQGDTTVSVISIPQ